MADWQLLNSRSKTNHLQVLTREVPNLANYYFFYLRLLTTLIMTAAYTVYALLVSGRIHADNHRRRSTAIHRPAEVPVQVIPVWVRVMSIPTTGS